MFGIEDSELCVGVREEGGQSTHRNAGFLLYFCRDVAHRSRRAHSGGHRQRKLLCCRFHAIAVTAATKDVGSFRRAFARRAAILVILSSGAPATGMGALL